MTSNISFHVILTCSRNEFAGEKRVLNSELWHACAGPLVSLPAVGNRVVYFPQGHSEQVRICRSGCNLPCCNDEVD